MRSTTLLLCVLGVAHSLLLNDMDDDMDAKTCESPDEEVNLIRQVKQSTPYVGSACDNVVLRVDGEKMCTGTARNRGTKYAPGTVPGDFDAFTDKIVYPTAPDVNRETGVCEFLAVTNFGTCADRCAGENLTCAYAQDNVFDNCTIETRHTGRVDRTGIEDASDFGCNQHWYNQLCACDVATTTTTTLPPVPCAPAAPACSLITLHEKDQLCGGPLEGFAAWENRTMYPNPPNVNRSQVCEILAQTQIQCNATTGECRETRKGHTCYERCKYHGMQCVYAQDNVKMARGTTCGIDPKHTRVDQKGLVRTEQFGCYQSWRSQICACAPMDVLPPAAPATCAVTADCAEVGCAPASATCGRVELQTGERYCGGPLAGITAFDADPPPMTYTNRDYVCEFVAVTSGTTCTARCAQDGLRCAYAQKNDENCATDPTIGDPSGYGCNNTWATQICGCQE